jgi:hypothetical protein
MGCCMCCAAGQIMVVRQACFEAGNFALADILNMFWPIQQQLLVKQGQTRDVCYNIVIPCYTICLGGKVWGWGGVGHPWTPALTF